MIAFCLQIHINIFKVSEYLNSRSKAFFVPSSHVSADESLIPFKGILFFLFMPSCSLFFLVFVFQYLIILQVDTDTGNTLEENQRQQA